jgi:hypothetical protein
MEDSANQTNYYNNPGDYYDQDGANTNPYRSSLNMSQPIPPLDTSSILADSIIQCKTEIDNDNTTRIEKGQ